MVGEAYPDLDIVTEMPMGTPARVLLAESKNAHVVVVGAKGEDIGNLLLGFTALQLVGHAACPVVVVVLTHVTTGHHLVVVGSDGSPNSTEALHFAFAAAHFRDARLQVISALGLPQGWPNHLLRPLPEDDEKVVKARQQLADQVAPLREEYTDVDVSLSVRRVGPLHALATATHRAPTYWSWAPANVAASTASRSARQSTSYST